MAVTGVPTNRTSINLPVDVSNEILQKTQESSAIMKLARQIALPGRGAAINVITGDPEAAWVGETEAKPVSDPGLDTKIIRAYKLAVIVPFSNEFRRDVAALYDALIERLPNALGKKFDETVFGKVNAPGSDFDTFANVTAQAIGGTLTYGGLVAADGDIATHGGIMNGVVLAPQGKSILLGATDENKRPLFINSVAEGAVPMVLGARTEIAKGAYIAGTSPAPNVVGFAGDWTQAVWGTVEGVKIKRTEDATLTDGDGNVISLFEHDMIAIRAEIEVGFRADVTCFNRLTDATA
jgi:HK97 family phage major capsid protein